MLEAGRSLTFELVTPVGRSDWVEVVSPASDVESCVLVAGTSLVCEPEIEPIGMLERSD